MKRSYVALLIVSMIWGTSFLFIHKLNETIGPGGVVFWRCLFGLFVLFGFIVFTRGIKWFELPWGKFLFVGLFNNIIPWFLISYGQLSVPSGVASVINALTPISTILIGLFFHQKLGKRQWAGIFIGYFGILFLVNVSMGDVKNADPMAVVFIALATLCYGTSTQFVKKNLTHIEPKIIAFCSMLWATPIGFILMMETFPGGAKELLSIDTLLSVVVLGCFGSGLAQILFYYLIKSEGPTFASATTYVVPLMAIAWGAIFLGEKISVNIIFGLLFVLSGVFLMASNKFSFSKLKIKEPR